MAPKANPKPKPKPMPKPKAQPWSRTPEGAAWLSTATGVDLVVSARFLLDWREPNGITSDELYEIITEALAAIIEDNNADGDTFYYAVGASGDRPALGFWLEVIDGNTWRLQAELLVRDD